MPRGDDCSARGKMTWRYQVVWTEEGGERIYSVCEVYLDEDGRLDSWTTDPVMRPIGEDRDDLEWTLVAMLADTGEWAPVNFASLKVGMVFERCPEASGAEVTATARRYLAAAEARRERQWPSK